MIELADREVDALIAERIMDWQNVYVYSDHFKIVMLKDWALAKARVIEAGGVPPGKNALNDDNYETVPNYILHLGYCMTAQGYCIQKYGWEAYRATLLEQIGLFPNQSIELALVTASARDRCLAMVKLVLSEKPSGLS